MKVLCGRERSGGTYCVILVVLLVTVVVLVDECSSLPAAVAGNSHRGRPHVSLPTRQTGQSPASSSHPRPSRRVVRPIVRPDECKHDVIFTDCFLCGKIAEANLIYRQCCERDPETVNFCNLLLS